MRKTFIAIAAGVILLVAGTASAQMGMMGGYGGYPSATATDQGIMNTLQAIYQSQGAQASIDCSKVTDDQFEKLGDEYMDVMLFNDAQHEAMDRMMGGEGSASLRQAHINMGRSYLGCWSNYTSGPIYMPMMYGFGQTGSYGLMGSPYGAWSGYENLGWAHQVTMVLVWVLLGLLIAIAVKWLRKK